MIISRTPYRISLFGGGTDYPGWYLKHGGAVLGTSINKYCYITCRYLPPFFTHRIRVVYSRIEDVKDPSEIAHPAVREVLRHLAIARGVEIHHDGDLPARSGLGSSSAFTVGLLHALYALKGTICSKQRLAREAIFVEQEMIRETVGSQDQVLTANGGFNRVTFAPSGGITVDPVTVSPERLRELADHFLLFYTGMTRIASSVAGTYVPTLCEKEVQMRRTREMVDEAVGLLAGDGDLAAFGALLDEAWRVKASLSPAISNGRIDEIYRAARAAGALGGKVIGAGGGGFMLFFAPPERHEAVRRALDGLLWVPFRFDFSGTQIIFYGEEEDYAEHDHFCTHGDSPLLKEAP